MTAFFKSIFINRCHQVRSGWKMGLVFGCILLGELIWMILLSILSHAHKQYLKMISSFLKDETVGFIINTLIIIGAVLLVLYILDKKRPEDIGLAGLRGNFPNLWFGFLLGAASIVVIFVILAGTGRVTIQYGLASPHFSMALLWNLVLFIVVGISEELFSRGYSIFVFLQMKRLWLAVLLSALIFSLLHGVNPNINGMGLLNIMLVGFLLTLMYLKSGNLWMPIGYHIAWNYFQGSVFGFPVSGKVVTALFNIRILRNDLLSGGLFGPEGGVLATLMILFGFGAVWL